MRLSALAIVLIVPGLPCQAEEPTLIGTINGHKGAVRAVAFSPGGNILATAGDDGYVRLWKKPSGNNVATFVHGSAVLSLAFSEDGKTLASGGQDGTIKVWNVGTGKNTATLKGRFPILELKFSYGDKDLRAAYPRECQGLDGEEFWDLTTGEPLAVFYSANTFFTIDLQKECADNKVAVANEWYDHYFPPVTSHPGEIKVEPGRGQDRSGPVCILKGHQDRINCMAVSKTGYEPLASGSDDGTIKLWDVNAGTNTATLRAQQGAVYGLAFSPNGRMLASGGADGTVKFWLMPDGSR